MVEHHLDTVGVAGSIPVVPTNLKGPRRRGPSVFAIRERRGAEVVVSLSRAIDAREETEIPSIVEGYQETETTVFGTCTSVRHQRHRLEHRGWRENSF